jgi:hypothetical protein
MQGNVNTLMSTIHTIDHRGTSTLHITASVLILQHVPALHQKIFGETRHRSNELFFACIKYRVILHKNLVFVTNVHLV